MRWFNDDDVGCAADDLFAPLDVFRLDTAGLVGLDYLRTVLQDLVLQLLNSDDLTFEIDPVCVEMQRVSKSRGICEGRGSCEQR